MKITNTLKSLVLVMAIVAFADESPESIDSIQNEPKPEARKIFIAPSVLSPSYGVFKIGYAYQYENAGQITKSNNASFHYEQNNSMVYFGVERGWIGGFKQMFMVGGYLDGAFGETFFLSAGAKLSLFLLNGWIIPYVGLGYQIENLSFPNEFRAFFMHTGVATVGVHFNISDGFGIDLSLRSGLPFYVLRPEDAQNFNHPHINHVGVMVGFSFYDFSL